MANTLLLCVVTVEQGRGRDGALILQKPYWKIQAPCAGIDTGGFLWCGRQELNLHGVNHKILSLARLPVPPRPHLGDSFVIVPQSGGKVKFYP